MLEWLAGLYAALKAIPSAEARLDRYRLSQLAKALTSLRFWNDGMLAPLRRIADGRGRHDDLTEIRNRLAKTENEVAKAGERLRKARDKLISTQLGMKVARELDRVIYDKLGPDTIRYQLRRLTESEYTEATAREAKHILNNIHRFNRSLDSVHEAIRPKTKASTPRSERGKTQDKKAPRGKTAK
jgi:hypothetical protein